MRLRSQMFMEALDVDDVIAHLLVAEGFTSLEQVAFVPIEELAEIEGFDEEVSEELRARARNFLEEADRANEAKRRDLGVSDELAALEGTSSAMLVTLGENGVKTLDDLGDLASDELIELLGDQAPTMEAANNLIMAARAHWFDDEPAAAGEATDGAGPGEAAEAASEAPVE
jgi:N utilization substance protein A